MTSLKTLQLQSDQFDDDLLRQLPQLPRLEYLSLVDTQISDAGLAVMPDTLPAIRTLRISGSSLSGEGVAYLQPCKQLANLRINGSPLTDAGLAAISQLHELQCLQIDAGPAVTPAGILLVGKLTNLQILQLQQLSFADEATSGLSGLSQLNTLILSATSVPFTDNALAPLASLRALKALIVSPSKLSPAGIAELQKSLPELTISP